MTNNSTYQLVRYKEWYKDIWLWVSNLYRCPFTSDNVGVYCKWGWQADRCWTFSSHNALAMWRSWWWLRIKASTTEPLKIEILRDQLGPVVAKGSWSATDEVLQWQITIDYIHLVTLGMTGFCMMLGPCGSFFPSWAMVLWFQPSLPCTKTISGS